jgi:hypothetical protein
VSYSDPRERWRLDFRALKQLLIATILLFALTGLSFGGELADTANKLDNDAEVTRQAAAKAATQGFSEQIVTRARQAAENYAELAAAMRAADSTNDFTERMALICGQTRALRDLAVYEDDQANAIDRAKPKDESLTRLAQRLRKTAQAKRQSLAICAEQPGGNN